MKNYRNLLISEFTEGKHRGTIVILVILLILQQTPYGATELRTDGQSLDYRDARAFGYPRLLSSLF